MSFSVDKVNPRSWFTEEWFRTGHQAQLLAHMLKTGDILSTDQFNDEIVRRQRVNKLFNY
jgi:hypothetical protein